MKKTYKEYQVKKLATHPSGNQSLQITSVNELADLWPLFREGLKDLVDPHKGRGDVCEEVFFKMLLRTLLDEQGGAILLQTSKNNKPLGFVVLMDHTEPYHNPACVVYAAYSNGKCASARQELQGTMEKWAKDAGYSELHAFSRRINGAAMRWFEKKCGFKRAAIVFTKQL